MKSLKTKTRALFYRFLTVVTVLAMLLPLSPAPSLLAQPEPLKPPTTIHPNWWTEFDDTAPGSQFDAAAEDKNEAAVTTQVTASNARVFVDLRDHGPDPETVIALVGQPVVWTNNGTRSHTITEGEPIFRIYLPLVLRGVGTSAVTFAGATTPNWGYTPLFDSGPIAPGEQFTYTFNLPTTGTLAYLDTFTYYSARSPGRVVGKVVVVQAGETVSETVEMNSAATISTTTGASLEIDAGVLLTDTVASITELPGDVLTDTAGTPVGAMYNVNIVQFDNVVSGCVTVTLPYDPALVPTGTDPSELEVAYFNGLSWIGLGGTVDDVNHAVSITTTHLSFFGIFKRCTPAFALSEAERKAYNRAKGFMHDILSSQDVYEAFSTSDGRPLFELPYNGRNARWLGTSSLCQVSNSTPAEIEAALGITATARQAVDTMIDIGERLSYAGSDHEVAGELVEFLSKAVETTRICLHILDWSKGALHLSPHGLVVSVVIEALKNSSLLYFDYRYSGKMSDKEGEISDWLQNANEVGQSDLDRVTEREELLADGCVPTVDYNGGFYEIIVCGSSRADPPCTLGYVNLFEQGDDLRFVVGIHGTWPFYAPGILFPDPTDRFYILLEYQDTNERTQASVLRFENYKTRPIGLVRPCTTVAGWVSLPNATAGTEVTQSNTSL